MQWPGPIRPLLKRSKISALVMKSERSAPAVRGVVEQARGSGERALDDGVNADVV